MFNYIQLDNSSLKGKDFQVIYENVKENMQMRVGRRPARKRKNVEKCEENYTNTFK